MTQELNSQVTTDGLNEQNVRHELLMSGCGHRKGMSLAEINYRVYCRLTLATSEL